MNDGVMVKGLRWLGMNLGGMAITPGDDLWNSVNGRTDELLSTRELAEHWACKAAVGVLARAFHNLETVTARRTNDGWSPIADQRGSDLLAPHMKRIAADVSRFGEFIAIRAEDSKNTPRELIPVPPDEVEIRYENGQPAEYSKGDERWPASKVFHIAEELPAASPLESIRDILVEDIEASNWRISAWRTSPRGIVRRGLEAPEWNHAARERFQSSIVGNMKTKDAVPVIEDGMEWEQMSLPDASAMQFAEARRMTADVVCSVLGMQSALLALGADRTLPQAQRLLLLGPVTDLSKLVQHAYANQLASAMYGVHGSQINVYMDVPLALRQVEEDPTLTKEAVGAPWRSIAEQRELEGLPPIEGTDKLASPDSKTVVTKSEQPIFVTVEPAEVRVAQPEVNLRPEIIIPNEHKAEAGQKPVTVHRDKSGLMVALSGEGFVKTFTRDDEGNIIEVVENKTVEAA